MTEQPITFALHRSSWFSIDGRMKALADEATLYAQEYPDDFAPLTPDSLFLEFKRAGEAVVHPKKIKDNWSRPLLKELALEVSTSSPSFIAANKVVQNQLCELHPEMEGSLRTRHQQEQEGEIFKDSVLLGANVMLFKETCTGSLQLISHQRDNASSNPYPFGYSVPGGIVKERPSLAAPRRLREELVCLFNRDDYYEMPLFLLPKGYNTLSTTEIDHEIKAAERQIRRVRKFARIRYPDSPYPNGFDTGKEIRVVPFELSPLPKAADIEGTLTIFNETGAIIDHTRGIIIDSPHTNHVSFAIPAVIPAEAFSAVDSYILDVDNLPFTQEQGGRDICLLGPRKIGPVVRKGECSPGKQPIEGTFLPAVRSKAAYLLEHVL